MTTEDARKRALEIYSMLSLTYLAGTDPRTSAHSPFMGDQIRKLIADILFDEVQKGIKEELSKLKHEDPKSEPYPLKMRKDWPVGNVERSKIVEEQLKKIHTKPEIMQSSSVRVEKIEKMTFISRVSSKKEFNDPAVPEMANKLNEVIEALNTLL